MTACALTCPYPQGCGDFGRCLLSTTPGMIDPRHDDVTDSAAYKVPRGPEQPGDLGYTRPHVLDRATPERPVYAAVLSSVDSATALWIITVDEGWRSSIVCSGMYEWAARWLVEQLQGKPFAPDTRP